ncbi:MarR family transcriptional regulator [Myxococcus sp. K15C18031901]|uniref:MarR family winged helix-turn-helix transcriptional regulator n=1 Tax=Myxococcus dinghuensis TaxID=2906761 RepID=UPI0020A7E642|nr:MarR family transcriptional regulator [Myxococcus dinghuensis]MCP3097937.1 MarR family transcriptional regulator [Myxococcus dinghuensis]
MSDLRGRPRDPIEFIETFGALWRCLMSVSDDTYAAEKLWSAQAHFLRHLGRQRGMSQAQLARATDMAPTLAGRLLRTLIQRKLVRRTRSEEDRREYALELTPSGQRMRERVEEARARFAARVVRVLDERDLQDFERIAKKLFDAFGGTPRPPTRSPDE